MSGKVHMHYCYQWLRGLTREARMEPPIHGLNLLSTALVFWTNFTRILCAEREIETAVGWLCVCVCVCVT